MFLFWRWQVKLGSWGPGSPTIDSVLATEQHQSESILRGACRVRARKEIHTTVTFPRGKSVEWRSQAASQEQMSRHGGLYKDPSADHETSLRRLGTAPAGLGRERWEEEGGRVGVLTDSIPTVHLPCTLIVAPVIVGAAPCVRSEGMVQVGIDTRTRGSVWD